MATNPFEDKEFKSKGSIGEMADSIDNYKFFERFDLSTREDEAPVVRTVHENVVYTAALSYIPEWGDGIEKDGDIIKADLKASGGLKITSEEIEVDEANVDHDSLKNYVADKHINWVVTGAEDIHDDRIPSSAITQHEGDIDHDNLTNTHNLTTDIDHDQLTNFVADKHINWKDASENLETSGSAKHGILTLTGINIKRDSDDTLIRLLSSSTLYKGGLIQAYGASHSTHPGDLYIDFGDYTAAIPSGAKLYIRSMDDGTINDIVIFDEDGNTCFKNGNEIRFYDVGNSNYVGVKAPALTGNQIWVLPVVDGDAGQYIKTDGDGNLSFDTPVGAGDMLKSTYDSDEDGIIDPEAGGTGKDSSAWTGIPKIAAGVWNAATVGIADDNVVEIDDADAADNDYAKFTANGLEGRSYAEVRSDLIIDNFNDVRRYSSFSNAISTIGATETTLIIPNQQNVTTNETVPNNITLKFLNGGSLNISNTKVVTINGNIEAGSYQIFEGAGSVSFGVGTNRTVLAEWWGAVVNSPGTDCAPAIIKAIESCPNPDNEQQGHIVTLLPGIYWIQTSISTSEEYIQLIGGTTCPGWNDPPTGNLGHAMTTIKASSGFSGVMVDIGSNVSIFGLSGIRINGNDESGVTIGLELYNPAHPWNLENVIIENVNNGTGIKVAGEGETCQSVSFERVGLNNCKTGLDLDGKCYHITFNDCILGGQNNGIIIGDTTDACASIRFISSELYMEGGGTADNIVTIKKALGVSFDHCWIEANSALGSAISEMIKIGVTDGLAENVSITNTAFISNSKATNAIDIANGQYSYIVGNADDGNFTNFVNISDGTHKTQNIIIHNPEYSMDLVHGVGASNHYHRMLATADIETGYRIQRNKSGGSYNDSWVMYMPNNSKDFRIWNVTKSGDVLRIISNTGKVQIEALKSASSHPANYKSVYVNTDTGELYRIA